MHRIKIFSIFLSPPLLFLGVSIPASPTSNRVHQGASGDVLCREPGTGSVPQRTARHSKKDQQASTQQFDVTQTVWLAGVGDRVGLEKKITYSPCIRLVENSKISHFLPLPTFPTSFEPATSPEQHRQALGQSPCPQLPHGHNHSSQNKPPSSCPSLRLGRGPEGSGSLSPIPAFPHFESI